MFLAASSSLALAQEAPPKPPTPPSAAEADSGGLLKVQVTHGDDDEGGLSKEIIEKLSPEQLAAVLKEREVTARNAHAHAAPEGIVVPIAFFLFIFGIVLAVSLLRLRASRHRHETLRLMVEKGVQIPTELIVEPPKRQRSALQRGVSLVALGVGLSLFLLLAPAGKLGGYWAGGLVFVLLGAGQLLAWWIERRGTADKGANANGVAR